MKVELELPEELVKWVHSYYGPIRSLDITPKQAITEALLESLAFRTGEKREALRTRFFGPTGEEP